MIIKSIRFIKQRLINQGQSIYDIGKEMIEAGVKVYKERTLKDESHLNEGHANDSDNSLRQNLKKNFTVPENEDANEAAKQISLKSHKLKTHPVSGENWNSNMGQRNFNNHQGN